MLAAEASNIGELEGFSTVVVRFSVLLSGCCCVLEWCSSMILLIAAIFIEFLLVHSWLFSFMLESSAASPIR